MIASSFKDTISIQSEKIELIESKINSLQNEIKFLKDFEGDKFSELQENIERIKENTEEISGIILKKRAIFCTKKLDSEELNERKLRSIKNSKDEEENVIHKWNNLIFFLFCLKNK